MKANELMIGDWVRSIKTKDSGQVSDLREAQIKIEDKSKERDLYWHTGTPQAFEGIPLTKEIILLNADRFSLKYDERYNPIPFWEDEDKFYCGCFGAYEFEVKYVHEVQNFLRVIGFSAVADNFIIK